MPRKSDVLTTPDLVVLNYLSNKPMHGYQLNLLLEEHEVKDWAGISRPQVYYSLKKLQAARLIRPASDKTDPGGPERQVYQVTDAGTKAFVQALGREEWATQRPPPPFLTWMALATNAKRDVLRRVVMKRRAFLVQEISREQETLKSFDQERPSVLTKTAKLMVRLTIKQFEVELAWLSEVEILYEVST